MSRTLQSHHYSNIRVASTFYTPAHSKEGNNISARLVVNAYANFKKRDGSEKKEVLACTMWDKGADVGAITLTPGKLFSAKLDHDSYDAPTYYKDQIINAPDGTGPIMRKASSWTIREFALGEDSFKHIMDEIQRGVRGVNWWVKGSPDALAFGEELKRRMSLVGNFNQQLHSEFFGFARVKLPKYNYGAYNPAQTVNTGLMPPAQQVQTLSSVGMATTPEAVAAAFNAAGAAPVQTPVQTPVAPQTPAAGQSVANFAMPQGV